MINIFTGRCTDNGYLLERQLYPPGVDADQNNGNGTPQLVVNVDAHALITRERTGGPVTWLIRVYNAGGPTEYITMVDDAISDPAFAVDGPELYERLATRLKDGLGRTALTIFVN